MLLKDNSQYTSFILFLVVTCVLCGACSPKGESRSSDPPNSEEKLEDIKRQAESTTKELMDKFSAGGQPGVVLISGQPAIESVVKDKKITISRQAGKGWLGSSPKVDEATQVLKGEINENTVEGVLSLRGKKTFIVLGCETSIIPPNLLDGFEQVKMREEKIGTVSNLTLIAERVFLCNDSTNTVPVLHEMISVVADTVYINGFSFDLLGGPTHSFGIVTRYMNVNGDSIIRAKAPDAESTILMAPSISLTVLEEISGQGVLRIYSEGANYKKADTTESKK